MRFFSKLTLSLFALLLIYACGPGEETSPLETESAGSQVTRQAEQKVSQTESAHVDSPIAWFTGSVEEAFTKAQKVDKPLFFYWGAVWCPPCQEIKNTVFKSSSFIELSKLFIPVYLDGDRLQAQSWGEHFGVKGYPTMIVFNPRGKEVTRIPGGIDVSRYAGILDLALNHLRPTSDLLRLALHEPDKLQDSDFTQLAFYSWGQDHKAIPEEQRETLFSLLSELAAKDPIASSRLFMQYLLSKSEQEESVALGPQEKAAARTRVEQILDSSKLMRANWDYLTGYAEELVLLLTDEGESRQRLSDDWSEKTLALHRDASLSTSDQLGGWYPTLELYWLSQPNSESLPQQLVLQLKADVAAADQKIRSPYARQSVIYTAASLLKTAHLYTEAETLLLAELQHSKSAYYFMSNLASLAEKRGDHDAAVNWLKKAYVNSDGRATRFQWGVQYVTGLIRLQPQQQQLVVDTTLGLFKVLDRESDIFAGRNFSRLKTLRKSLQPWRQLEANRIAIQPFYDKIDALCDQLDAALQEARNCRELKKS